MNKHQFFCTTMALAFSALASTAAHAADTIRYKSASPSSPIAAAVEVPAGMSTIYLSGQVPPVVNTTVPANSIEAFGDTKTQTIGVLTRIKASLAELGLTLKDVVKVQVFLVADPKLGKMDFAGFSEGYAQFFGGEQASLNARSTMAVSGLVNPGWLVEIEVTTAKQK